MTDTPKTIRISAQQDLGSLRQKITELVSHNALTMVQCAIDAVNEEGQYQAIKYLFEMVGLYPAAPGGEDQVEDSMEAILLNRLELAEAEAKKDSRQGGQTAASEPLQ